MSDASLNDIERRLARTLHAAAPLPDPGMADRLLRATAATAQRRPWFQLRLSPALAAAAVVVLAVAAGLALGQLLAPSGPQVGPPAPASPSAPASVAPSPEPSVGPSATAAPSESPPASAFPGGSRCESRELGYTVSYPEGWFANERVVPDDPVLDPVPACAYFSEVPVEVAPNAGIPADVAIWFDLEESAPPPSGDVVSSAEVVVAGRPATVREVALTGDGPFGGEGDRVYEYQVELSDGRVLLAMTDTQRTGDYAAHREVLDDMMSTLELLDG